MVINDKLKGEFYRTPMTKLSSRRNIVNKLNELIDYFNNISNILNESFDSISDERSRMIVELVKIQEKILHFKYIVSNFNLEVDQHIYERLQQTISNFDNVVIQFTNKYSDNLFDHNGSIADAIDGSSTALLREWNKSVNSLSSTLGIQWYGGKISEKSILNKLNNVIHVVKMNNYEGNNHEDYINSGLILEVFVYTTAGMIWLVLGENGLYGHNFYVKYQSPNMNYNIKLGGKTFNSRKGYDLNRVDFDFILSDLIGVAAGDVYIKFCTNIPANNESGKSVYLLNGLNSFKCYENLRNVIDFTNGALYQDNKDLAFYQQSDVYLKGLMNTGAHINTVNIINLVEKNYPVPEINDSKIEEYNSYFRSVADTKSTKYSINTMNPVGNAMTGVPEEYSGIIIDNSEDVVNVGYISTNEKKNMNIKDKPDYVKGDLNINMLDYRSVGDVSMKIDSEEMVIIEDTDKSSKALSENPFGKFDTSKTVVRNWASNDTRTMDKIEYRKRFIKDIFNVKDKLSKSYVHSNAESVELKLNEYTIVASSKDNSGLLYSTDNGRTWVQSDQTSGSFQCLTVTNDGTIIAGGDIGLWYSKDGGKTWTQSNITSGDFNRLTVTNDGTVIAAGGDIGLWYSKDNGKTWIQSNQTSDGFYCLIVSNDGTVIAAGGDIGLWYSIDNGRTWTQSNITSGRFYCLIVANDGTVIAGSYGDGGLLYSTDNGKTWIQSNRTIGHFECLTVANDGTVIAGANGDGGLYYSEDNGRTWTRSNITSGTFYSLTVADDGTIITCGLNIGLYYSTDNGKTWTRSNITSRSFSCSTVANDGTIIASGYKVGIYYSTDNGRTWTQSNITSGYFKSLLNCVAKLRHPLKNVETITLGKYKIFNHYKGLMYQNTKTNTFQLTSFDETYHFSSYCKHNDSTIYLGTKSGILKVELTKNNELVFTRTNIVGGEIGSFVKFNNGIVYAFRMNSPIFIKNTDGGIGNNRYFLKDYMYVYYEGVWYEFTDLCNNVLGIDATEINKISYESSNSLITLFQDNPNIVNSVYKQSENSAIIFKNQNGKLNHFTLVGDTIKGVFLPLVRIDVNSIESSPKYTFDLSDSTKLIYSKYDNYLIISGLNVQGTYKYQIYNMISKKYEDLSDSTLYNKIFKPSNNRYETTLCVKNKTFTNINYFAEDCLLIVLPTGKRLFLQDPNNIINIGVGPNDLVYIISIIRDITTIQIIDINGKNIETAELTDYTDLDGYLHSTMSVNIDSDGIVVTDICSVNNLIESYNSVVLYPPKNEKSSISMGFTANQLKK